MRKSSTGRITIAAVAKLQPGETLNDDKLPGFSVRRQRTKAVYSVRGRFNHQRIRLTIGRDGRFTPDEARTGAKRLIGLLASGIDPRIQSGDHTSFGEAAKAFTEHTYAKRAYGTARAYDGHFKRYLVPLLGSRRLESISPATLARLHLKLKEQPVLANRILDTASSLYGWAARKRLCPSHVNPASKRLIERYKEHGRERFLSYAEVERLGEALRHVEAEGRWSPFAVAAIPLLLLTGCRRDEVRLAKWEHIDWDRCLLHLPSSKGGRRSVHLNDGAVRILLRLRDLASVGTVFIIRGASISRPYANLQDIWEVVRDRARLGTMRLHDLRHSAASFAGANGASLPLIGAVLGHKSPQSTKRYVHVAGDPARQVAAQLGASIVAHLTKPLLVPIP